MSSTIFLAFAGAGIAALPLLVSRRKSLLNPALLVFAVVTWSLLLEALYIAILRPVPIDSGWDHLYVKATSSDFFFAGAFLVFVAVCGYVAGFFSFGRRTIRVTLPRGTWAPPSPRRSYRVLFLLLLFVVACFVAYLVYSGVSLAGGPMTAKRFQPTSTGVPSRFLYIPYYFFRLSLVSGSLAYAAVLVLSCSGQSRSEERKGRLLFSLFFIFAVALSHFASLRLIIVLLVLQILILIFYVKDRRHLLFVGTWTLLALMSFGWITLIARAIPTPPVSVPGNTMAPRVSVQGEEESARARQAEAAPTESTSPSSAAVSSGGGRSLGRGAQPPGAAPPRSVADENLRRFLAAAFEGRYLMNIAKMAQLAHHFPEKTPFLKGESLLGRPPASVSDVTQTDGTFNRYLSRTVFGEPNNNIAAGLAGELYINFGHLGVLAGFLALGVFHRLVFNHLTDPDLPTLVGACMIVLIPNTTLVLLDVGVTSAVARSILDIGAVLLVWLPWTGDVDLPPEN